MPYPTIASRAIPYHNNGSVVKIIDTTAGLIKTLSAANMEELNDEDLTVVATDATTAASTTYTVMFFPEKTDVKAIYAICTRGTDTATYYTFKTLQGSADTTNGLDGTWTAATCTPNAGVSDIDGWRKNIATVTDCNDVVAIRFLHDIPNPTITASGYLRILHVYGNKNTGETANDILFLDALDSDAEFTADLDFGDRPSETSTQWQIKLQNASSLTASTVDVAVNDPNDIIRIADADTGPWNTTKTYASITTGAKTAICYIKCETPAVGTLLLGPHCPFIDVEVGSYS